MNSLLYKFNPSGETDSSLSGPISSLCAGDEIEVEKNSKIAKRILALFSEAQKAGLVDQAMESRAEVVALSQPAEREFVLRVNAQRPQKYSVKCPQFMRAILGKNEFRLCGAFSQDITFF